MPGRKHPSLAFAAARPTVLLLLGNLSLAGADLRVSGLNWFGRLASAELYDPQTRTWTATGSMAQARGAHAAVLLGDGRVLVASGFDGSGEVHGAELYDPATGTWSLAAPLVPRHYASLNLLPDGLAMLAGGWTDTGATAHAEALRSVANTWTATGTMGFARAGAMGAMARATVLPSGLVLMAGSSDGMRDAQPDAELYDRTTGLWTTDGSMGAGRENGTAHLLPDGDVPADGDSPKHQRPSTHRWSAIRPTCPRDLPVVDAVPLLQRAGMALT